MQIYSSPLFDGKWKNIIDFDGCGSWQVALKKSGLELLDSVVLRCAKKTVLFINSWLFRLFAQNPEMSNNLTLEAIDLYGVTKGQSHTYPLTSDGIETTYDNEDLYYLLCHTYPLTSDGIET